MEVVSKFAEKLMGIHHHKETDDNIIKHYNNEFEIIVVKDKRSKNPNIVIVDKRNTKHIIYNDMRVAMNMINL
jgi:hypothetical protein